MFSEIIHYMKKISVVIFALFLFLQSSYTQSITEDSARNYYEAELKKLADKYNRELRGVEINGIHFKSCKAIGKTLIWQYDVPNDWYPLENGKANIIEDFKKGNSAELYFQNGINVEFQYFTGNKLRSKIYIKSEEFASTDSNLNDFISIKGHSKSQGIDIKLKAPKGWKIEEGDRPHIVKKFIYTTNGYMTNAFLITITDNIMFVSRNQARIFFEDKQSVNELLKNLSFDLLENPKLLDFKIVSIDKYPALEFTICGNKERAGIEMSLKLRIWYVFYEDKIIVFQASSLDNGEFERIEPFYIQIINSIIFPEQYER